MIKEFANYLRSIRGYSENTIRAYVSDLVTFQSWVKETNSAARWRDISRETIDNYLTAKKAEGLKPATTNRHLAAISSLYRYFQRNGYEVENPCKYESRRKMPMTIPTTIPTKQLAMAYKKAYGVKKTIIGILATTGIRLQELLDLQWEDINFEEAKLIIKGKGAKERVVYTEPFVLGDLQHTYNILNPHGKMFYISQRHARYMVYQALKPYCHARQLSPHAIRHTYATELAKNGENCSTIAKLLGHSHLETSQKYIDMSQMKQTRKGILLT